MTNTNAPTEHPQPGRVRCSRCGLAQAWLPSIVAVVDGQSICLTCYIQEHAKRGT